MTRDLGLDAARDRQMHDTFDPDEDERRRASRRRLDSALATVGPLAPARKALDPEPPQQPAEQPATPRKRDWHNVGTRVRTARLSDELWDAVKAEAERTNSTTSTIVRDALDAYLDRRP